MDANRYYYESDLTDPCFNLALEEYILLNRLHGDYILLWQNANTVVVGCNQNAEEEINRKFVDEHGVTVVRRTTGGGAVYHDLGNLCFSFITDFEAGGNSSLSAFVEPVVKALRDMGVSAEASGKNDISVDGKKVSGNAQRLHNNRILHHGTLLFDTDPSMVSGALNVSSEKFRSKSVKSVRGRICNIRDCLPQDMDMSEFKALLREKLTSVSECRNVEFSAGELKDIRALAKDKYRTWEWTYAVSPQFELSNRARFSGGGLDVGLSVCGGRIESIRFTGDFMARKSLLELEAALIGCRFERSALSDVLAGFTLEDYFGTILGTEVLDTMLYCTADGGRR